MPSHEEGDTQSVASSSYSHGSRISKSSKVGSKGQQVYDGVKSRLMAMTLELEDKTHTVKLLQRAREKESRGHKDKLKAVEEDNCNKLNQQRAEFETAIERQLQFVDKLLKDKSQLAKQCEALTQELQGTKQKSSKQLQDMVDKNERDIKAQKEAWAVAEKQRREKWMAGKEKEIKSLTIKGLEPEVQRILSKHKSDLQRIEAQAQADKQKLREEFMQAQDESLSNQANKKERESEKDLQRERAMAATRADQVERQWRQEMQVTKGFV